MVDSVVAGSLAEVAFAFTLSADDTVRTKPRPDPYRAAAERFGVAAGACVAVEDVDLAVLEGVILATSD